MKKIFSLFLTLLIFLFTNAQLKQIAEGPKFAEPEEGYAKIIQMKSGSVFYVSLYFKTGIDIRIYDASHTQKVVTSITPSSKITKFQEVESIFEINNDIILFLSDIDNHAPVLYRLTIDGNTGKLKEEKTIATMKKAGGTLVNNAGTRFFSITKDPYSDNYAIAFYNMNEPEREKRVEIVHYGNDHREISRVFCISPDTDRSFFLYINMTVLNSEKVCAFLFASKEKYFFGKKGNVLMATIEKGSALSYSNISFPEDQFFTYGLSRYNPVTKKIILLTVAKETKRSSVYAIYSAIIDLAANNQQIMIDFGPGEKLNTAFKETYDKKDNYSGMPQNLFINDDGSFSVIYEEIMVQSQSGSGMGFGTSSTQIRVDTKLSKMAIANYDKEGSLTSNFLVPKAHWIIFQELAPFYHAKKEGSAQQLYRGNQYKSFAYLNGTNKNYILFNDTERNNEVKKDRFVEVQGISDCDAFMYKLTGNEIFPKREYAFEAPDSKGHNIALYSISDYDRKNNVYVTLRLDKETRTSKEVKLVWLQPQ